VLAAHEEPRWLNGSLVRSYCSMPEAYAADGVRWLIFSLCPA
jgi:hypothetical protein